MKKNKTMTFAEWIADQIRAIAPYSKTAKATDRYFATCGNDDVNVEFSRRIGGYSNHHFTTDSLKEFYHADKCTFCSDFSISLEFNSLKKED